MKKVFRRISVFIVCVVLLTASFLSPVAFAATGVYELTFDNLFVFEQWANHPNLKVHTGDNTTTSTLTTNIENGSFVLVNNTASTEVFTTFSMSSVGAFYSMPVEENTEYVFSYVANGTTTNFEAFIFYFDFEGNYFSHEAENAYQYGLNEWNFTTPENTSYIQIRFDNNSPQSDVTVSDIKIRSKAVYDYAKDNVYRKTFTYTAGATYGALPVPEKDGLVFAGWYTGPNGTGEKITSSTAVKPASLSLYAKWDPIVDGDLSVVSLPAKQDYCVGEKLNTRGLVIGVSYPDGKSENIDEGFSCSPEYFTSAGTQAVTVTYGNSTATFNVNVKSSEDKIVSVNDSQKTVAVANNVYTFNYSGTAFNRYTVKYTSDAYVKGEMSFNGVIEEFFLEPGTNAEFSGYIDGFISGTTQNAITSITFTPLDKDYMDFTLTSIDLEKATNPGDSSGMVYLSSSNYKIGIDLDWGGALTYLEDLSNNVVSARKKPLFGSATGNTEVGFSSDYPTSGISNRYTTQGNVNLINAHDTGRLVQQSYYGTGSYPYEPGMYGEAVWNYNPVQGGNLYNEASKIVDVRVSENELYIKCRPLDWAKEAVDITPSYMEAWYTFEDGMMRATCRFVDFSGYPSVTTSQELPAFYCVEPLNDFVYYSGGEAWSDSNTKITRSDLGFWGTATDQDFICNENWAAFVGNGSSGYGVGIYCPGQELFHTGVYYGGDGATHCTTLTPATEDPTSYMGIVDYLHFQSYKPISYCYYIKTGNVDTIRSSFKTVAQTNSDICNATNTNGFCDMCGKAVAPELTTDKYDIDGNGTKDSVYEISNVGELYWFRDTINGGNTTANAVLVCDITDNEGVLTSYGTLASDTSSFRNWTPIGDSTNRFNGCFDGQGYTVNGLYMQNTSLSYGGLFGYTDSGAIIKKVGVDYSYFSGNQYVGAICGYNNGTIENCYSLYTVVTGTSYVGGLTGYNNGTVNNCYNSGIVNATNYVGGVAGQKTSSSTISNCYYLVNAATDGDNTVQNGVGNSAKGAVTSDVSAQTQGKTIEEFASGEVAYLLQSTNTEPLWGQINNVYGSAPEFDTTGKYAVHSVSGASVYSLVDIGDIDADEDLDAQDYQQLVNRALTGDALAFADMHVSDIDGDGALDAIDCSLMETMVSGNNSKVHVYSKGDYDGDGVAFTEEDIAAIKKGIINLDKLNTKQKYACDLNFDGIIDINDRDMLTEQNYDSKQIFTNMEEVFGIKSATANVIILCGQSNAYGASPLTDAVRTTVGNTDFSNIKIKYNNINSDDGTNNWRTHYSNNAFGTFRLGIGGQADMWFGPEVGLSYHLATNEATKGENWYIIKYTAAGTYLGGNWLYDTTGKYYNAVNSENVKSGIGTYLADGMVSYVDEALNEIAAVHGASNINIRAFMWHQGESDSCVKEWADQYGDLQNMLVNKVRTEFESRDSDNSIGFVDGGIAAYNSEIYYNGLTGTSQSHNSWVYSDTVNTHKTNNASLWYVPAATSKNIINKIEAGLYQNTTSSTTKLTNSIWVDTSTCLSKLANNNENGEYDGAHYCGDSMFRIGVWYAQGMLQVSNCY
ncbi:MAG: bacterial Ig-like domain-containing protein [Clostridia bacterium]|nr:bacterial Ig-like domain-containing protein [Clostridia bacterium]